MMPEKYGKDSRLAERFVEIMTGHKRIHDLPPLVEESLAEVKTGVIYFHRAIEILWRLG